MIALVYAITRLAGPGQGLRLALGLALGLVTGVAPIPAMAADPQTSHSAEAAVARLTPPKLPARRRAIR